MRKLLFGLAILAIILGGAWFAGESWLSGAARDVIAARQDMSASVSALRQPGRIGLHLQDIEVADGASGTASLSGLDAYVRLRSPTTLTLDLPRNVTVQQVDGAETAIALGNGQAEARIDPTRGMAVSQVRIAGREMTLNQAALFEALTVTARLTHMGGAAPAGSAAAYRIDLDGAGLVSGSLPETLDISGAIQVWLDRLPDRTVLEGSVPPPQPTGLQTQDLTVSLGDMTARLAARVEADEDGLAQGQAAIYTSDGPAFVDTAVAAGLLTPEIATPLQTLMINLAAKTDETAPADTANVNDPADNIAEEEVTLPQAGPGEVRLPIFFGNGIMRLGPIPLGPAPRIAGF